MSIIDTVIDGYGGTRKVARKLKPKGSDSKVSNWRARGKIPAQVLLDNRWLRMALAKASKEYDSQN